MRLEDLEIYQQSMDFGEKVWNQVKSWKHFEKDTIGKQLVKSADSIAANISEGFGRFHYKENKNFCYYARGSLYESKTFLNKAYKRILISEEEYKAFLTELNNLGIKLNNYITTTGKIP